MDNIQEKLKAVAEIIEGNIEESEQVEVLVKGSVLGFPATLQAVRSGFPFGVSYYVETELDKQAGGKPDPDSLMLSLSPRYGSGLVGFFTRLLLFESKGQPVGDKAIEKKYICSHNSYEFAEKLVRYPGMAEKIGSLAEFTRFSELVLRERAGVFLSQPLAFSKLDTGTCRETFKLLGDIGQVLFDEF